MARCVHAFYSGIVQGVGFRFTAERLAKKHVVCGWVRNLADGRGELIVEGHSANTSSFLKELKERFKGYVTDAVIEEQPARGECVGFQIRLTSS